MRKLSAFFTPWLLLLLTACSGIETQPADTATFAAGSYKYYKWRNEPLRNTSNSGDSFYLVDRILREEVDAALAEKGYLLDPARAQFSVGYVQGPGFLEGVSSQDAWGGIDPIPSARPNRQVNQAMVDNANALSGVHETQNIALQLDDTATQTEVWHVLITKIVENANETDVKKLTDVIHQGIREGLKTLPDAD
ncbi:hypothetical protein [Haliea sp. E17]|uniref:hypothetical protein n=1 Tax=Haliea sp. E17 TaxID=3401576 RepID=UPI003AAB8C9D